MPTRIGTFKRALESVLPQLDSCYVFLDRFSFVPDFLSGEPKIKILRSQEVGDYRASAKFLPLQLIETPSNMILFDDDILYPSDYVARLLNVLAKSSGAAVAGVHGRRFHAPFTNYITGATGFHFARALKANTAVDELGTGTCAFLSTSMDFRIQDWAYTDAVDIQMALEAQKRALPQICIERRSGWLKPFAENQPDSNWSKVQTDCTRHTALMRKLMKAEAL